MPRPKPSTKEVGKGVVERPFLSTWSRDRYTPLYLAWGPSEETVQTDIMGALQTLRIRAWVTDAGAKGVRGRLSSLLRSLPVPPKLHALILSAVHAVLPVGHPDIAGFMPDGRALYLEVKAPEQVDPKTGKSLRPAGKPSAHQLAFLDGADSAGCVVGIVWSNKDAIEIIKAATRAA